MKTQTKTPSVKYLSVNHYGEVRFNIIKEPAMELLLGGGLKTKKFSKEIAVHGKAIKTFGNWRSS